MAVAKVLAGGNQSPYGHGWFLLSGSKDGVTSANNVRLRGKLKVSPDLRADRRQGVIQKVHGITRPPDSINRRANAALAAAVTRVVCVFAAY